MSAHTRVIASGAVAFVFYFGWTWWVNSMATGDRALVFRSAILQGTYSAAMTAGFTGLIDRLLRRWRCHRQPYLAVVVALLIQSNAVVLINVINGTPSLLATVAPSVLFSAIYGFVYARALRATPGYQCPEAASRA